MPHVKVNGIELYYETAGKGPGLLLISGLGEDTRVWAMLVERLRSSFKVAALDLRGAGQSEKPGEPYTIGQMTVDVHEFIREVLGGRAHVLGHSMGGCVAMQLALAYPGDVDALVLLSSLPAFTRPHPIPERVNAMFHRTDISPELLAEVYDTIFGADYKKKHAPKEFIEFRLRDENPQPAYAYLNQMHALENFDLYNDVEKIDKKTLIIAGGDDGVVPLENSVWMNKKIRNSSLKIIPGVGHQVEIEAPDELAGYLISQLNSSE